MYIAHSRTIHERTSPTHERKSLINYVHRQTRGRASLFHKRTPFTYKRTPLSYDMYIADSRALCGLFVIVVCFALIHGRTSFIRERIPLTHERTSLTHATQVAHSHMYTNY